MRGLLDRAVVAVVSAESCDRAAISSGMLEEAPLGAHAVSSRKKSVRIRMHNKGMSTGSRGIWLFAFKAQTMVEYLPRGTQW